MNYHCFLIYNIIGGILWVAGFLAAGYLFGNVPLVKRTFSLVILAVIGVSLLPLCLELVYSRFRPPVCDQDAKERAQSRS
jgi:membrane-associated protein